MSDKSRPWSNNTELLKYNSGATAAAVEILIAAGSISNQSGSSTPILDWAIDQDNLMRLRDKIIECAKSEAS